MIQTIIDGIAEALFQEFGSGYEIHTEEVKQGLVEPCFLIRCLNPTKNLFLGRCYRRTNQFSIQYIPSEMNEIEECNSVAERLFECLEDVILHGKPIHGTELNSEVKDGILTFTVNYDGFVLKDVQDETAMGDFDIKAEVKG